MWYQELRIKVRVKEVVLYCHIRKDRGEEEKESRKSITQGMPSTW